MSESRRMLGNVLFVIVMVLWVAAEIGRHLL